MDVREKVVEMLGNIYFLMIDGSDTIGEYTIPHKFKEKIADHLISNGVTVQEWISVEDRLPDWRDGKVLVFTKYGFSICERTVNNRWRGQHANWITHWAYLPKPPKGE